MNAEPGGAVLPRAFDASTPGDKTWLRLHNRECNSMNLSCQAFSTPQAAMKRLHRQTGRGELYSKQAGR